MLPMLGLVGFVAWRMQQARRGNRERNVSRSYNMKPADLQRRMRTDAQHRKQYVSGCFTRRAVEDRTRQER
jgi:hypothetical protein